MADISPLWVQIIGMVITLLTLAIGGTRQLSRSEATIRELILTNQQDTNTKIAALRIETSQEHDETLRNWGEGLAALRTKIHEVEVWNRDNFVRHRDFTAAIEAVSRSMEALSAKMDASMSRLESKIERITAPRPVQE